MCEKKKPSNLTHKDKTFFYVRVVEVVSTGTLSSWNLIHPHAISDCHSLTNRVGVEAKFRAFICHSIDFTIHIKLANYVVIVYMHVLVFNVF